MTQHFTHIDISKLKSETNEAYLLSAADVIGSIVCIRAPRRDALTERRADREAVRRRARNKMIALIRLGGSVLKERLEKGPGSDFGEVESLPSSSEEPTTASFREKLLKLQPISETSTWKFIKRKLILISTKWKGANNEPPPPFTTTESLWSFTGCFITLLMLLNFSDAMMKVTGYSLVTGPFGALMTLQYCLTAAP